MKKSLFRNFAAVAAAMIIGLTGTFAQGPATIEPPAFGPDLSVVTIKNFGKMDDRFYRGAQPEVDDFASLKAIGVNTIIDLRNDPTDYGKSAAEQHGMKYVNIPMSGWKYAKDSSVKQFMDLMNDPATGVAYVHCKAGKHRTGLVGAVYRFNKYDWDYDQAYSEMKKFNYTSWPVHFNIKSYVKDYSKQFEKQKAARAASATASAVALTAPTGVTN